MAVRLPVVRWQRRTFRDVVEQATQATSTSTTRSRSRCRRRTSAAKSSRTFDWRALHQSASRSITAQFCGASCTRGMDGGSVNWVAGGIWRPQFKADTRTRATAVQASVGSEIFEKGQKTIYQSRRHLSQIHTTDCMPFTRKNRLFEKNSEPIWGRRPHRPLESATGSSGGSLRFCGIFFVGRRLRGCLAEGRPEDLRFDCDQCGTFTVFATVYLRFPAGLHGGRTAENRLLKRWTA